MRAGHLKEVGVIIGLELPALCLSSNLQGKERRNDVINHTYVMRPP
jgi:hypothetical protein